MFIRGMSDTVKTKLAHYGPDNLEPGDILLTNDAYITGSHLNHMTFTVPVSVNRTKIAAALAAMVAIAGKVSVRAAQVDAPKSASANVKMPTIGQDSVGTCSPGSGKACCEAAAGGGEC